MRFALNLCRRVMSNVVSLVKETIVDALDKLGYELVDIEYEKQYGQMTLTVYIYKDGGVTLDDCETVSRCSMKQIRPLAHRTFLMFLRRDSIDRLKRREITNVITEPKWK